MPTRTTTRCKQSSLGSPRTERRKKAPERGLLTSDAGGTALVFFHAFGNTFQMLDHAKQVRCGLIRKFANAVNKLNAVFCTFWCIAKKVWRDVCEKIGGLQPEKFSQND